jgi:hypothetical protein
MELLPHKILSHREQQYTSNPRSFELDQSGPRGGNLVESLKQKYGLGDAKSGETRQTSTKFASGIDNAYQTDVDKLLSKYSTTPYRPDLKDADESDIHDEIAKVAEDGIARYGINPSYHI